MADGPTGARDGVDLTPEQRADIDGMYLRIAGSNYYELLGVPTNAERRAIRDAYFALSQRFHPDAFYGRPLGPWKARIEEIFREVTRAYETLSNRNLRVLYDNTNGITPESAPTTPTSADATGRLRAVSPDDSVRTRAVSPDDSQRARAYAPDDSVRTRALSPDDSQRARPVSPDDSVRTRAVSADESQRARALSPDAASRARPASPDANRSPLAYAPTERPPPLRPPAPVAPPPVAPVPTAPVPTAPAHAHVARAPAAPAPVAPPPVDPRARVAAPSPPAVEPRARLATPPPAYAPASPPRALASAPVPEPSRGAPVAPSPRVAPVAPNPPPPVASADQTGAHRALGNPPAIDADAARRAAREALARRMGLGAGPARPPGAPPQPGAPGAVGAARPSSRPPPPLSAEGTATALKSLDADRAQRQSNDRATRLARILRDAEESLGRNDLLGASNAYAVARAMAPEDTELAARAEQLALKYAESQVDKLLEVAREAERVRQYDKAAEAYLKAHIGRRNDAGLLVRAAQAMLTHGKELPRAAETARRAMQISPRSMEAHLVLARIFLAGGLRASALAVLDAAQKVDPTSLVVKDLIRQCKGKA